MEMGSKVMVYGVEPPSAGSLRHPFGPSGTLGWVVRGRVRPPTPNLHPVQQHDLVDADVLAANRIQLHLAEERVLQLEVPMAPTLRCLSDAQRYLGAPAPLKASYRTDRSAPSSPTSSTPASLFAGEDRGSAAGAGIP